MDFVIYALRYLALVVYTVLWGLPATLIGPFDRRGRVICWIGRQWIRWILGTCGIRVECEGLEHVERDRPQVFMCNHQSVVDIAAIIHTIPVDFHFVAKKELGWIPLFGWALASSVGIMVDRGNRAQAVERLRRGAERVRAGANVIVFPEGTRSPSGTLGSFKSGGFHLAIQAQVPVVPVTVSGSHRITPKRSLRIESGTVKIVYGPPLATQGLSAEDREELKRRVRVAIAAGFDPAFQEVDAAA